MEKKITIDYQEYLSMQNEIEKLKEANSALCQGAPVLEVNEFRFSDDITAIYRDVFGSVHIDCRYEGVIDAAGRFVAKGRERGVSFEGVELLISSLEVAIKEVENRNYSKEDELFNTRERIKEIINRSLWQRIINKR